ncbi:hypothetical protein MJO28_006344 [Puccinia striiformis f. sp. tritici]|uniref:Uncharacterized protein n=1 Tax=Puccinia striiformis f. sp. tritici TaxID=168172 RepID=A0ACC0EIW6_9BASI|nr:hypothetical protein MJO28_006344 [Puccinia striiformis f. sp. tritici]
MENLIRTPILHAIQGITPGPPEEISMDFLLKVIPKPKGEVKNLRFQGESKSKSPTGTILWEESNCRAWSNSSVQFEAGLTKVIATY